MTDAIQLAPLDEDSYYQDPAGFFARLRGSRPVAPVRMPGYRRMWVVTRYEDVRAALTDPRLAKDVHRWILASVLAYGSPDRPGESQRVTRELAAYLTGLIAARRAGPGDDLLSALVRARDSAAEEVPPARVRRAG